MENHMTETVFIILLQPSVDLQYWKYTTLNSQLSPERKGGFQNLTQEEASKKANTIAFFLHSPTLWNAHPSSGIIMKLISEFTFIGE